MRARTDALLVAQSLGVSLAAQAPVITAIQGPEAVFGFRMGADRSWLTGRDWRNIGGRYFEERGLVERSGGLVGLALMLYSFDDRRSSILMTSFWPGSPRRWAEFEGCLMDHAHTQERNHECQQRNAGFV